MHQVVARSAYGGDQPILILSQSGMREHLGHAQHTVDRGTNLMTQIGEEHRLRATICLCREPGRFDRRAGILALGDIGGGSGAGQRMACRIARRHTTADGKPAPLPRMHLQPYFLVKCINVAFQDQLHPDLYFAQIRRRHQQGELRPRHPRAINGQPCNTLPPAIQINAAGRDICFPNRHLAALDSQTQALVGFTHSFRRRQPHRAMPLLGTAHHEGGNHGRHGQQSQRRQRQGHPFPPRRP